MTRTASSGRGSRIVAVDPPHCRIRLLPNASTRTLGLELAAVQDDGCGCCELCGIPEDLELELERQEVERLRDELTDWLDRVTP